MRYLHIDKENLPYVAQVPLYKEGAGGDGTLLYDVELHHNTTHDFITLSLSLNGEKVVSGEKLMINQPVRLYGENAPSEYFVPRNRPGQQGDVILKNLGDTVLLALEGGKDEAVET